MCKKEMSVLSKKFYSYHGKTKGALEITDEKIICKECVDKLVPNYKRAKLKDMREFSALHFIKKDHAQALEKLNETFNEKNAYDWYNKAALLMDLERYNEALNCYDGALFLDTHYVKAWYNKGLVLNNLNHEEIKKNKIGNLEKLEAALKCFDNVIELEGKKKDKYPRDNWKYAASFYRMLTLSFIFYWLVNKKTSSEKIENELFEAVNKWSFLLGNEVVVEKNKVGSMFWEGGTVTKDNYLDFIEMCTKEMGRILNVYSPASKIGGHKYGYLGYRH